MLSKKWSALLIVSGALLFTGCSNEKVETEQPIKKTEVAASDEAPSFELSSDERERYLRFQKDLDHEHLQGLEPLSIAKIYVKSELDQNHDVHYALYTDREGSIQWTKEEDEAIPERERGTKEQIKKEFQGIEDGTFIQTSDDEGYIEFTSGEGTKGFQMIRNEDGVWQVAFMPIQ